MKFFAQLFFFVTISLIISTYFLYPAIIYVLAKIKKIEIRKNNYFPLVSVIISAFNEEKFIVSKIKNIMNLDYPDEKIEILIGSDGSMDRTAELVLQNLNDKIKFFNFKENRGKTAVQNDLVKNSKGEILVFMDAASMVEPEAIKEIVANFADERVGCVGGSLYFDNINENITTASQGIYWKYELLIRKKESDLGRMIGVDGPLYAIRKNVYEIIDPDIISDFISPLMVLSKGKNVILEPKAKVFENPTKIPRQEINTRRRITVRALHSLFKCKKLISFQQNPVLALQIFFHKLIRWFVGPLLTLNFICAFLLWRNPFFKSYVVLGFIFLGSALVGLLLDKYKMKIKLFAVPYYFILVNFAAFLGIIDFLRKKNVVSWKPVR